jgi:hypothetical protein
MSNPKPESLGIGTTCILQISLANVYLLSKILNLGNNWCQFSFTLDKMNGHRILSSYGPSTHVLPITTSFPSNIILI